MIPNVVSVSKPSSLIRFVFFPSRTSVTIFAPYGVFILAIQQSILLASTLMSTSSNSASQFPQ